MDKKTVTKNKITHQRKIKKMYINIFLYEVKKKTSRMLLEETQNNFPYFWYGLE